MEYIVADFKIECQDGMIQIARDLLTDDLGEVGFECFEDSEDGIVGYIQKDFYNGKKMDEALKNFLLPDVSITYTVKDAEYKNWNSQWEEAGFEQIDINGAITIYDARHQDASCTTAPVAIGIETRQAFGTGTHETTRMVIAALLDLKLQGKRVLDCGCGTGILGIAASKLGAEEVVGYDIDEWSTQNAAHNASLNNITNMQVMLGDASVLKEVEGEFDVIMANINRNMLLNDMPTFVSVMTAGSTLVLSGFYSSDVSLLEAKATELGMEIVCTRTDNEWTCLTLSKKK